MSDYSFMKGGLIKSGMVGFSTVLTVEIILRYSNVREKF